MKTLFFFKLKVYMNQTHVIRRGGGSSNGSCRVASARWASRLCSISSFSSNAIRRITFDSARHHWMGLLTRVNFADPSDGDMEDDVIAELSGTSTKSPSPSGMPSNSIRPVNAAVSRAVRIPQLELAIFISNSFCSMAGSSD